MPGIAPLLEIVSKYPIGALWCIGAPIKGSVDAYYYNKYAKINDQEGLNDIYYEGARTTAGLCYGGVNAAKVVGIATGAAWLTEGMAALLGGCSLFFYTILYGAAIAIECNGISRKNEMSKKLNLTLLSDLSKLEGLLSVQNFDRALSLFETEKESIKALSSNTSCGNKTLFELIEYATLRYNDKCKEDSSFDEAIDFFKNNNEEFLPFFESFFHGEELFELVAQLPTNGKKNEPSPHFSANFNKAIAFFHTHKKTLKTSLEEIPGGKELFKQIQQQVHDYRHDGGKNKEAIAKKSQPLFQEAFNKLSQQSLEKFKFEYLELSQEQETKVTEIATEITERLGKEFTIDKEKQKEEISDDLRKELQENTLHRRVAPWLAKELQETVPDILEGLSDRNSDNRAYSEKRAANLFQTMEVEKRKALIVHYIGIAALTIAIVAFAGSVGSLALPWVITIAFGISIALFILQTAADLGFLNSRGMTFELKACIPDKVLNVYYDHFPPHQKYEEIEMSQID